MFACMYICMCMYVCMHVCIMYVCVCVCVCVCVLCMYVNYLRSKFACMNCVSLGTPVVSIHKYRRSSERMPRYFFLFFRILVLIKVVEKNWVRTFSFTRFLDHTQWHTTVGLLWTSDQLIAETSTDNTQHSHQTSIHLPGGIQTHNLSRRAAADLRQCGAKSAIILFWS